MQLRHLAYGFLLFLVLSNAQAVDLYRWVDANGKTHMSDMVPERYRDVATKVSSQKYELTAAQLQEAQARAAKERERSERSRAELEANEQARQRQLAEADAERAKANGAKGPKKAAANGEADCQALWKEYLQNSGCFNRFRTVKGGLRPEAFSVCSESPSPVPTCQARTVPTGVDPFEY